MSDALIEGARRLVAEAVERPLADVPPDAAIGNLTAWDSLAHIRIILALEKAVGEALTTDAVIDLRSVEDVARIMGRLA